MAYRPEKIDLTESAAIRLDDFAADALRKGEVDQALQNAETATRVACLERQQRQLGEVTCHLSVGFDDSDEAALLRATCEHCVWTGATKRAVAEAASQVEQAAARDRLAHKSAEAWKDFAYFVDNPQHPLHGHHVIGVESLLQLPSGSTLKQPHSLMANLAYLQFKHMVRDDQDQRRPGVLYPAVVVWDEWLQDKTGSRSFRFLVVERMGKMLVDKAYLSELPRLKSKLGLLKEAHRELRKRGYLSAR